MRWDKSGIPHKGWQYIGVEDVGDGITCSSDIPYEECEMCGNEKIRYVHILRHPDYHRDLRVGCVCAENMMNDYLTPKSSENDLKNMKKRQKNFMQQEWRYKESTGNYILNYKGMFVTIIKSKYGQNFGIVFNNQTYWNFKGTKLFDLDQAKQAAFFIFDKYFSENNF